MTDLTPLAQRLTDRAFDHLEAVAQHNWYLRDERKRWMP